MAGSMELPLLRDLSGHRYKCHASVVDLDPKPVACVEKHRRRNLAMNEAFLLSNSKNNSDQIDTHYDQQPKV